MQDIPNELSEDAEYNFQIELFDFNIDDRPLIHESMEVRATLQTLKQALEPIIQDLKSQGGLTKKESPAVSEAHCEKDSNADTEDDLVILNRAAKKMTPEKQKKLLEMAKLMFAEDFDEDE